MSSIRSTPSPPVPPIITNERDREFLVALNAHIDSELQNVDKSSAEQRYTVYKVAFDQIIDYVTAYKPLLTAIKAEYEECIETILRGQREAFYLSGKLKSMAHEPSTLHNYRKRAEDLQNKISIIDADNERLRQEVQKLQSAREERERKARATSETPRQTIKKDKRPIPGLSLQQSTDLKTLTRMADKMERQLKELTLSYRTRYTGKDIKENLKHILSEKVIHRDQLTELSEVLKIKRHKLKIAVEAAQAYLRIQPPHQTIGDAVVMALAMSNYQSGQGQGAEELAYGTPSTTFEDDDPAREKEAEMMLEYIEKFNELMEEEKYEAAAIHAANSPKGILRTPETLARFKEIKQTGAKNGRSPLLAFCDALMSTVLAYGVKPSEYLSMECITCALNENRLDLLSHWISQNRLTTTEDLGLLIYNYCLRKNAEHELRSGLALAQKVFADAGSERLAMLCMVRQGRIAQALEYAKAKGAQMEDYTLVLSECPSPQLALALYTTKSQSGDEQRPLVPLGVIASTLNKAKADSISLHLIEEIYKTASSAGEAQVRDSKESWPTSLVSSTESPSQCSSLRDAVFDDHVTTEAEWLSVCQRLQENGNQAAAVDLLAAVTVKHALLSAKEHSELGSRPSKA